MGVKTVWGGTLPPHFYVEGLVEVQSPNYWTTRRFPKWRDFHCGNTTGPHFTPLLTEPLPFGICLSAENMHLHLLFAQVEVD